MPLTSWMEAFADSGPRSGHDCARLVRVAPSGFSLIEILAVVVLLGILAAVVVPQFAGASTDARRSKLNSDLYLMNTQIRVYKAQHHGRLPHINADGQYDGSAPHFIARLIGRTDEWGGIDADGERGPYLLTWPGNPFCESKVAQDVKYGLDNEPPKNGKTGWYYNLYTGQIHSNAQDDGG